MAMHFILTIKSTFKSLVVISISSSSYWKSGMKPGGLVVACHIWAAAVSSQKLFFKFLSSLLYSFPHVITFVTWSINVYYSTRRHFPVMNCIYLFLYSRKHGAGKGHHLALDYIISLWSAAAFICKQRSELSVGLLGILVFYEKCKFRHSNI